MYGPRKFFKYSRNQEWRKWHDYTEINMCLTNKIKQNTIHRI